MKSRTIAVIATAGTLAAALFSIGFIFMAAAVAIDGAMSGWSSELDA